MSRGRWGCVGGRGTNRVRHMFSSTEKTGNLCTHVYEYTHVLTWSCTANVNSGPSDWKNTDENSAALPSDPAIPQIKTKGKCHGGHPSMLKVPHKISTSRSLQLLQRHGRMISELGNSACQIVTAALYNDGDIPITLTSNS